MLAAIVPYCARRKNSGFVAAKKASWFLVMRLWVREAFDDETGGCGCGAEDGTGSSADGCEVGFTLFAGCGLTWLKIEVELALRFVTGATAAFVVVDG